MTDSERYIPGVPCWVDTSQPDPRRAVEFYSGLFGWEITDAMPDDSAGEYLIARLPDRDGDVAAVASVAPGAPPVAAWNTYVWVESADETATKVLEAAGSVLLEPFDVSDAGRMAVFADPEGAVFRVWQPNNHRGATVVNEPGSVNFNGLNTRDVATAKRFYGAVFGWETITIGGEQEMWALPAYGDRLEQLNPGTRARMAEMGAPAGFENVVATITPLGADRQDVPAHWDVTFAVEDADAVAAKAPELGATILVAPFDAPWVRMTVIQDPQGATFIASQFVPPSGS